MPIGQAAARRCIIQLDFSKQPDVVRRKKRKAYINIHQKCSRIWQKINFPCDCQMQLLPVTKNNNTGRKNGAQHSHTHTHAYTDTNTWGHTCQKKWKKSYWWPWTVTSLLQPHSTWTYSWQASLPYAGFCCLLSAFS